LTSVNNTGGEFITGVIDTRDKFMTGVVDTSDKSLNMNIYKNIHLN